MAVKKTKPAVDGPAWTKAQRAGLHGARRAHPLDPPAVPTTREDGWAAVLGEGALRDALFSVRAEPEGEALLAPLRRSLASGEMPATLDPVTESLRAMLLGVEDYDGPPNAGTQGLVAFWIETAGIEWLWTLAREPARYAFGLAMQGDVRFLHFDGVDRRASDPNRGLGVLGLRKLRVALRRYFFALPEAEFRVKAEAFKRAWGETASRVDPQQASPGVEATYVAFVLGRDGSHAHALVREGANGRVEYISDAGLLLASVTDLAVATKLVADLGVIMTINGADFALDFVETFGADAAPLLEAIVATSVGRKPKLKPYYAGRFAAAIKLAKTAPALP